MKKHLIGYALLALIAMTGIAFADGYDLSVKSILELRTATAAAASGDYDVRYIAADNAVEKIDATNIPLTGAFNGTVGATTPSTGSFTTLAASSTVSGAGFLAYFASPPAIGGTAAAAGTFTTDTVNTALVSKASGVTNDLNPAFSTNILGNPVVKMTYGSCTVAAVNGGTCIPLALATGRTISLLGYDIVAAGSAATCTGILLEDTNGTPVVGSTIAAAGLTSGAHNFPGLANNVLGVGFGAGSGLTVSQGLQIIKNGSNCATTTAFQYAITYTVQ